MASICNNDDDNGAGGGYQPYFIIDAKLYRLLVTKEDVDCLIKFTAKKQIDVLKLRCSADNNNILHIAACFGHLPLVEQILEKWSQLMIQANSQGDLAIHSCLRSGRFCAIGLMIDWLNKNNSKLAKQVLEWNSNHREDTLLHIALELCDSNNYEIVKKMVDLFPAASYATNKEGICPLYMAIKRQHPCLVRHILLKLQPMKAEALACLMNGQSVIHVALSAAGTDMLEHLLSFGGEELINLKDKNGWTALSCAASLGNFEKVEIFQSKVPESAFICNNDRSFPIHLAVLGAHFSIVYLLNTSLFLLNSEGQNILHLATLTGNSEMVLQILKLPNVDSLINQKDKDGNTALHLATQSKHIGLVKALIHDQRVQVKLSNKLGFTANDLAKKLQFSDDEDKNLVQILILMLERAEKGIKFSPVDDNIYQLLVEGEISQVCEIAAGRKVDLKDFGCLQSGNTILHIGVCIDRPEVVTNLLQSDCKILMEQTNKKGDLPIHAATKAGKLRSLKALFRWPYISVEDTAIICQRQNKKGNTALHIAMLYNHMKTANYLYNLCPLAAYSLNRDNICPLFLAIKNLKEKDMVKRMIQGLEGNLQLHDRLKGAKSVVHMALFKKRTDILKSIIETAPDLVDSLDIRGRSTLSYAAHIGHVKGVQLLMERFPHLEFKRDEDIDGSFPIHQAAKGGHIEVIKLLHPTLCLVNNKHQNILHIAAATGRNTTVKYLLMLQEFKELINTRDDNGNTPLHLAVKGYRETVAHYLAMENNIDGNSLNNDLLTARDLFEMQLQYADQRVTNPTSLQIHLIDLTLKQVGAVKSSLRETYDVQVNDETKYEPNQTKKNIGMSSREREIRQRLTNRERAGNLLVVAALIVTVTFAAAFTPPGGFNEKTGMPTLHNNSTFKVLIYFNAFAFIFALGSAITLILGMTLHKFAEITLYWGWCFIILGLISMSIAFMTASSFASQQALNSKASLASLTISMTIMISLLIAIPFLMLASTKFVQVSKLYVKLLLRYCAVDSVGIDLAI